MVRNWQSGQLVRCIHEKAPEVLTLEVDRRPDGRAKGRPGFPAGQLVGVQPDDWHDRFLQVRGVIGIHPFQYLPMNQHAGAVRKVRIDSVDVRKPEHVVNPFQDGVGHVLSIDDSTRRFATVISMMKRPTFPDHQSTESASFCIMGILGIRALVVAGVVKGVRCRPQHDHRFASLQIPDEMLHVSIRQFAKSELVENQIRPVQQVHSRDVGLVIGIDAPIRVLRKQDRALETMTLAEDFAQLR